MAQVYWVNFQNKKCFIVSKFWKNRKGEFVVEMSRKTLFTFTSMEGRNIRVSNNGTELSMWSWTEEVLRRFWITYLIDRGEDGELPGPSNVSSEPNNVRNYSEIF